MEIDFRSTEATQKYKESKAFVEQYEKAQAKAMFSKDWQWTNIWYLRRDISARQWMYRDCNPNSPFIKQIESRKRELRELLLKRYKE
jgi:hypothetical protein